MKFLASALAIASILFSNPVFGAAHCTLDHPDQDVKRLFPESTSYRVRELIPYRHGKRDLMQRLARDLEYDLDKEYETKETPFTFYVVYKKSDYIGIILGTNLRGENGPIQVFLAYGKNGKIREAYVQKISSSEASAFRSKFYREQYRKFGLSNIPDLPYVRPPVRQPSSEVLKDHQAFIRGVRLNILLVKTLYNEFKE
jgi:hypothetical protein